MCESVFMSMVMYVLSSVMMYCMCVCVCEALSNEHATITNMHVHATHTTYAFRKHIYHFQDILLLATELLKQMRPQPMKPVAYMET